MNNLLDENDEDIEDRHSRRDREITLGTTMVLGIFFALAVFGAVMFGFGYSIGTKHVSSTAAAESATNATFGGFKPPSGKSADDLARNPAPQSVSIPLTQPVPAPLRAPVKPAMVEVAAKDSAEVQTPLPPRAVSPVAQTAIPPATRPAQPPPAPAPAIAPSGTMMVQIAAVSHQEDADLLLSTLRRRNYAVAVHSEPQDRLLHVQVGPYANRKDADAMRLRLQADGFNAIVKDTSH